jgi:hypothetical protein
MPPAHEPQGAPRPHRYDLHDHDHAIGRLEWRPLPRRTAGWYLMRPPGPAQRLSVDPAIDELAGDERSPEHDWELNAELAAILSTALALDAAEQVLHPRDEPIRGRFRRLSTVRRYEIYVSGLEPSLLAHTVPELPLTSVADTCILEGELLPEGFAAVVRRVELLGGTIVAVFGDEGESGSESG